MTRIALLFVTLALPLLSGIGCSGSTEARVLGQVEQSQEELDREAQILAEERKAR